VGFAAHLFFDHKRAIHTHDDTLQTEIESRLAELEPDVEVVACERLAAERLRIVLDRPGGVDLGLCERVTDHLRKLLVDYGLEVSSPGPNRPLVKPDHFRRFLGRQAKVRTREPRDGRRSFSGELVGASDDEVIVAADSGVVSIPYSEINRSNLMEEGAPRAEREGDE
jgi:ribosome maturation factor RimP